MPTEREKAIAALAYALFDSENTTRLSEAAIEDQSAYFSRATSLVDMIKNYRNKKQRVNLARYLRR
jgi:hypothetical protein